MAAWHELDVISITMKSINSIISTFADDVNIFILPNNSALSHLCIFRLLIVQIHDINKNEFLLFFCQCSSVILSLHSVNAEVMETCRVCDVFPPACWCDIFCHSGGLLTKYQTCRYVRVEVYKLDVYAAVICPPSEEDVSSDRPSLSRQSRDSRRTNRWTKFAPLPRYRGNAHTPGHGLTVSKQRETDTRPSPNTFCLVKSSATQLFVCFGFFSSSVDSAASHQCLCANHSWNTQVLPWLFQRLFRDFCVFLAENKKRKILRMFHFLARLDHSLLNYLIKKIMTFLVDCAFTTSSVKYLFFITSRFSRLYFILSNVSTYGNKNLSIPSWMTGSCRVDVSNLTNQPARGWKMLTFFKILISHE